MRTADHRLPRVRKSAASTAIVEMTSCGRTLVTDTGSVIWSGASAREPPLTISVDECAALDDTLDDDELEEEELDDELDDARGSACTITWLKSSMMATGLLVKLPKNEVTESSSSEARRLAARRFVRDDCVTPATRSSSTRSSDTRDTRSAVP